MKRILILLFVLLAAYGAYKAFIFYDNSFKYGRMWETPAVKPHEQPLLTMASGLVPVTGGEAVLKAEHALNVESPLKEVGPEVFERGKELYLIYCAQCHGKYYDGKGTVGQSFQPLPGDLRSGNVQSMPEGVFFKEISYGIPGGRQPPLASTIAVLDRWRIISYIQSLGPRT